MEYSVRPMSIVDVLQVSEIERNSFPSSWPPTPLKRELSNRMTHYLVAYAPLANAFPKGTTADAPTVTSSLLPFRILRNLRSRIGLQSSTSRLSEDLITGYVGIWLMTDEAHITSIAVKQEYRRSGIGELLMLASIKLAMMKAARLMTLEARVSNFGAHALYEKYGYRKVGIRKGYYLDNNEDAVIMSTDTIVSPEYESIYSSRLADFRERRGEIALDLGL